MQTQKILTLVVDVDDGAHAMRQIQDAAGPGTWRIVSLLDLHDTQGALSWLPDHEKHSGRRVLAVVEQGPSELEPFRYAEVEAAIYG
jgi:hypothetical protein